MEGTLISELKKKKLKQIKIQQRVTAGVIALLGIAFSFWKSSSETAILVARIVLFFVEPLFETWAKDTEDFEGAVKGEISAIKADVGVVKQTGDDIKNAVVVKGGRPTSTTRTCAQPSIA